MSTEYTPPWGQNTSQSHFGETQEFLGRAQNNIVARTKINARAKGRRGEQEIVKLLQEVLNECYRDAAQDGIANISEIDCPKMERNLMQSMKGGHDIIGLDWLAPEVKRIEKITDGGLNGWWEQAKKQAKVREIELKKPVEPVLFYRPNGTLWNVRMYGYLLAENGIKIRVPVDTSWIGFRTWFKFKVKHELLRRGLP